MIKAVMANAVGVPTGIVLGLSEENWRRLRAGQPIPVRLRELHPTLPDLTVLLLGGDTEESLTADLRAIAPIVEPPR
jgi:hypothetical protein